MCEVISILNHKSRKRIKAKPYVRGTGAESFRDSLRDLACQESRLVENDVSAATFPHLVELFVANGWLILVRTVVYVGKTPMLYKLLLTAEQKEAIEG